jgi:hypothetical protein
MSAFLIGRSNRRPSRFTPVRARVTPTIYAGSTTFGSAGMMLGASTLFSASGAV